MLEILRKRRSSRKFKPEKLTEKTIDEIKEILLRSPTSKNTRAWEFILIDNPELILKLSQAKPHGSSFLQSAPFAVVIIAQEEVSDVWIEDCSIAAISLQYYAEAKGLGSCWIQIRKRNFNESLTSEEYVKEILNIPESRRVASIIALGEKIENRPQVPFEKLNFSKIKTNQF